MSGICKISDFGISKRTDDLHGGAFTAMQGTVFWMAPEVINTQKKGYNFKIDIWSVGCVVLEMWAGMRPWIGEEMVAVMFKVCSVRRACYLVTDTLQLYQSKLPPPVPEDVVLSELADDFRRKCFAMYALFLVGFLWGELLMQLFLEILRSVQVLLSSGSIPISYSRRNGCSRDLHKIY